MAQTKRRTPTEWHQLITEKSQSGETREAFCRARGIPVTAFQSAVARKRDGAELFFPVGVRVVLRGC